MLASQTGYSGMLLPTARFPCTVAHVRYAKGYDAGSSEEGLRRGMVHDVMQSLAGDLLGRVGLKEALQALREAMLREALSRTQGSRRGAADLLKVDRAYVQRFARQQGES